MCARSNPKISVPGWLQKRVIKNQAGVCKKMEDFIKKAKKEKTFPKQVIIKMFKKTW